MTDASSDGMSGQLLPIHFEKFAKAGHAIFTLVGKSDRYTYLVEKAPEREGYSPIWFVSVLTGPNNTSDYRYIGELVFNGSTYRHGRKAKLTEDAPSVKAFKWTWNRIVTEGVTDDFEHLQIWHVGKCGACGRPLTTPESVRIGIGPICLGK